MDMEEGRPRRVGRYAKVLLLLCVVANAHFFLHFYNLDDLLWEKTCSAQSSSIATLVSIDKSMSDEDDEVYVWGERPEEEKHTVHITKVYKTLAEVREDHPDVCTPSSFHRIYTECFESFTFDEKPVAFVKVQGSEMEMLAVREAIPYASRGEVVQIPSGIAFDVAGGWHMEEQKKLSIFKTIEGSTLRYPNRTILSLGHSHSTTYYHFIYEVLPKLGVVGSIEDLRTHHLDIYISSNRYKLLHYAALRESWLDLDVHLFDQAAWPRPQGVVLIPPSFTPPLPGHISPPDEASRRELGDDYLRSLIASSRDCPVLPHERAYVVVFVRTEGHRKVVNLVPLVQKAIDIHGDLNWIFLTDEIIAQHSINSIRCLMKGAVGMIGGHGAGLTNMIFLGEGAFVIEIVREEEDDGTLFQGMAERWKHRYFRVLGVDAPEQAEDASSSKYNDVLAMETIFATAVENALKDSTFPVAEGIDSLLLIRPTSGIGNVIHGLISGAFLAHRMNRAFRVEMGEHGNTPCQAAYTSLFDAPVITSSYHHRKHEQLALRNRCDIDVTQKATKSTIKSLHCENAADFNAEEKWEDCPTIGIKSNQFFAELMPEFRDNFSWSKLTSTYLRPHPNVRHAVSRQLKFWRHEYMVDSIIAVHIRSIYLPKSKKVHDGYEPDTNGYDDLFHPCVLSVIQNIRTAAGGESKRIGVYVLADMEIIREKAREALEQLSDTNVLFLSLKSRAPVNDIKDTSTRSPDICQDAWIELQLAASADISITFTEAGGSTFSSSLRAIMDCSEKDCYTVDAGCEKIEGESWPVYKESIEECAV